MTDRMKGCTVAFEIDIREDDVEPLLNAIRMLRGVLSVAPIGATHDDWIVRQRVEREFEEKLWAVLRPKKDGK